MTSIPKTLADLLARESIRHTIASYTMAGDRLKVDDFAAVFTEDAILETEGVPEHDSFCHEGRQAIRQWMERWREGASSGGEGVHQATFVRHHLATCLIDIVDDSHAHARTYWTAYTDIGPDHAGYYVDTLRKEGDRWLIAWRRIRLDWRSDGSLMFTAIERTAR